MHQENAQEIRTVIHSVSPIISWKCVFLNVISCSCQQDACTVNWEEKITHQQNLIWKKSYEKESFKI